MSNHPGWNASPVPRSCRPFNLDFGAMFLISMSLEDAIEKQL
jgi:hypothetical protein